MATQSAEPIRVGSIDELKTGGCRVVTGVGHAVAVFYHDGRVYAVDNRCPHLGFPAWLRRPRPMPPQPLPAPGLPNTKLRRRHKTHTTAARTWAPPWAGPC